MNKHVQIRNVSPELHRQLAARAKDQRLSLSAYILQEMERIASLPTLAEMGRRLRRLPPVESSKSSAALVREGRNSR